MSPAPGVGEDQRSTPPQTTEEGELELPPVRLPGCVGLRVRVREHRVRERERGTEVVRAPLRQEPEAGQEQEHERAEVAPVAPDPTSVLPWQWRRPWWLGTSLGRGPMDGR